MANFKLFSFVYLCVFMCSSSFGWKWETNDAFVKEVWPESDRIFKRASATTSSPGKVRVQEEQATTEDPDDSDEIIFDGKYFNPNEVPPPPEFMVANNNWHGAKLESGSPTIKIKSQKVEPLTKTSNNFYYVATVGSISKLPPLSHKFTLDNVKGIEKDSDNELPNRNRLPENKSFYSDSRKEVETSSADLDELPYGEEEDSISNAEFQNAPKCFTATDTQGHCLPFRQCYPVVFNVIDGDLRNPGLAKLLYQSSGPCNATLEFGLALSNKEDENTFFDPSFYNQSICCPGFKHPPTLLRSWGNEIRNTRLTSTHNSASSSSTPSSVSVSIRPILRNTVKTFTSNVSSESEKDTVEGTTVSEAKALEDPGDAREAEIGDIDEESEEREQNTVEPNYKGNSTATAEKVDADVDIAQERRNPIINGKQPSNAFLAIPSPDLVPNKCRQQIYGMPRGHWPWMVALVIRSRHICSGALIDDRHVLTAAHCVYLLENTDIRKLRVIIGDRVMYSSVDGPHFWRKVSKVITHANYNQQTFAADIAVLRLNSNVHFSRNIQPVSLSDFAPGVDSSTFTKGIVAGWSGADIGQPSFEARTELETVVDIMEKEDCRQIYRGFALSGLATNTFCTKPSNNTCVADSGAPLIVRAQNCWVLSGIMSWGLGCSHFPEVYTDVTRFTSWIRRQIVK